MKCSATTLAIVAVLSASLALAEDFKMINGKIYKEATISRVEADGIVLRTRTGIYKIYFVASQRHPGPFSLQSSDANRSSAQAYADQGRGKTG